MTIYYSGSIDPVQYNTLGTAFRRVRKNQTLQIIVLRIIEYDSI